MRLPSLKRLFNSPSSPYDDALSTTKNIDHNPNKIMRLLTSYADENQLITVERCGTTSLTKQTKYTTGIISIDNKTKAFNVDDWLPSRPAFELVPRNILLFSLVHHGIRCQFKCEYIKQLKTDDGVSHLLRYPTGIEQIQLRDAFRVDLSNAHPIYATLTHATKPPISGIISDISATGIRINLDTSLKPEPSRGERYQKCHIQLDDSISIECNAQLMHWHYETKENNTFLGIQFIGIDGKNQRTLNRYITQIQRKRKQKTSDLND